LFALFCHLTLEANPSSGRERQRKNTADMTLNRKLAAVLILSFGCFVLTEATDSRPLREPDQQPGAPLDESAVSRALCPLVYQVDHSPSSRGYRYIFYGNGFFIDEDGYLLTAAHVLSQLHGGQPYVLLRRPGAPLEFAPAALVAVDRDHDVAILRATPSGRGTASFLPLAQKMAVPGETVVAAILRPMNPRDAYTSDPAFEERSAGDVLGLEFSQLEKGRADTELFLFNHAVRPGDSGAPVISVDSHEVVGLVEGQWLRDDSMGLAARRTFPSDDAPRAAPGIAPLPGAVIPIHYAIALLERKDIAWRTTRQTGETISESGESAPTPLSLVPAPYPGQSLFGGEVLFEALVDRRGTIADLKVVRGEEPFLDQARDAVRTWTFFPARMDGQPVEARMAIDFQFAQSYVPPHSSTVHHYQDSSVPLPDRAVVPLTTVEPEYPSGSGTEGSVILYESIDREGNLQSTQVVRGLEPLTAATLAAAKQWRFAPAKRSGAPIDSAVIVIVTFRRPATSSRARQIDK
jgi:outer membrane biosynthesis protein TonB/S1-C subfamily serine protease